MIGDDINDYMPSILNPRRVKKGHGDLSLTQNSIVSRTSLSLKKKNILSNVNRSLQKVLTQDKENIHRREKLFNDSYVSQTLHTSGSIPRVQRTGILISNVISLGKENWKSHNSIPKKKSIQNSVIDNVNKANRDDNLDSLEDFECIKTTETNNHEDVDDPNESLKSVSSATELNEAKTDTSSNTVESKYKRESLLSLSFSIKDCETVDLNSRNSILKRILFSHKDNTTNVDCEMIEGSVITIDSEETDEEDSPSPPKRSAITVNLEIKRINSPENAKENSKILILNTNAIEQLSHVIVQPPNYKLVKRQILDSSKLKNSVEIKSRRFVNSNKRARCDHKKQTRIDTFLRKHADVSVGDPVYNIGVTAKAGGSHDDVDMSKNLGLDTVKCDRGGRPHKSNRNDSARAPQKRECITVKYQQSKTSEGTRSAPAKARHEPSLLSPRKNTESLQFSVPSTRTKSSHKNTVAPKRVPYFKIVAGTHFAVDAFSYGDIPNVKHYFLTHFHSDHYAGLKKGFNKTLFCSKITGNLCTSRLGVNPKHIHIINFDQPLNIDGIEVTAVDANHCPGAMMLIFSLGNGKSMLHTGDFRASPLMESYPVFWNKDIHTVYLDTTYCNPRYDFPTQDQSLEMALYILRQKKLSLEKAGKKFSSVLIVCGTYTIGKEKFFLGMARRVGCSVWACPEKDRVLQVVEGRSFTHAPPYSCQLHVVPMRDLTHEKLRVYLESLQGAFSELIAFKPSGWENGKNSSAIEKDLVTIHGIPYSEHSSFSEMIRFCKFLKPKQVVPTVDISGGVKAVQKYFPCSLLSDEEILTQRKLTEFFSIQSKQQVPSVT